MPSLAWVEGALVQPCSGQPKGRQGRVIDGGVYGPDGALIDAARHQGERSVQAEPLPLRRDDLPITPGRYLFGGWLQRHFGHLVHYSLGRLWALREAAGPLDGVVFLRLPDHGFHNPALDPLVQGPVREILACLGVGPALPAIGVTEPMRFASLAVPEQVILGGPGSTAESNSAFVAMLRSMLDSPKVRRGLEVPRLYVSRRKLGVGFAGLLIEEAVEQNLQAEGYAVMYPEMLPVAEQAAIYASARRIIFAEGSALHLALGFIDPDSPVAVISRRPPLAARPGGLMRAAGLRRSLQIDAVNGAVATLAGERMTEAESVHATAVLDFEAVGMNLADAGLITGEGWRCPAEEETAFRIEEEIRLRRAAQPGRVARFVDREEFIEARRQRLNARG